MTAPVVEGSGLSVSYGQRGHVHHAVVDLTLAVRPGEIVGVTGASGCGKSTTLRLLAGLEQPHAGTVRLGGADIWPAGRTPRPPRPGYVMPVFQDPVASLDRRWPIWRSVTEPLTVGRPRMSRQERMAAAREHLARLSLDHLDVRCLPTQLSGGQCQRVAIARALVAGPALVVADEPTASLDVTTAAGVTRVLREAADQGTALVIVSHDQDRLSVLADRILRMNRGRVVAEEVLRPLVHARRGTDE